MKLYILMNLSTQYIMKNNIDGSRKPPNSVYFGPADSFSFSFRIGFSELNIHEKWEQPLNLIPSFSSNLLNKWWSLFSKNPFLLLKMQQFIKPLKLLIL